MGKKLKRVLVRKWMCRASSSDELFGGARELQSALFFTRGMDLRKKDLPGALLVEANTRPRIARTKREARLRLPLRPGRRRQLELERTRPRHRLPPLRQ